MLGYRTISGWTCCDSAVIKGLGLLIPGCVLSSFQISTGAVSVWRHSLIPGCVLESYRISTGAVGACDEERRINCGVLLCGGIHRAAIIYVIEMAGARSEAVAVFRSLLRTRRQCFAGDPDMLAASAKQIREEFEANRNVGPGEELDSLISKGREGVEFMRVNIVQAKLNERGNYEMKLKQEHQGGELEPV